MNFLITPLDGVLTEITNDAAARGNPNIDIAANLYFGIGSTIFVAIVLTFVSAKLVEPRLGTYEASDAARRWARNRGRARGRGARPALRAWGHAGASSR